MLIDDVKITVKAGNGGDGLMHLRRNAMTAFGGPDGGNGGKGGDIYVKGVNDIDALSKFRFKKNIKAEDGGKGKTEYNRGKTGEDLVLLVPLGTEVTDEETGQIWDVESEDDKFLIAKGGNGGRGNSEFRSSINQTPRHFENGKPGEEKKIHLVLKLFADIGLIGLPNAGKSSLLKVLTNAHPKIGNYAFTTLEPNLGVMFTPVIANEVKQSNHIVIADIPGIIEGASKGKGLGIKFLKHVEKTKVLIHCIDSQSENIKKDYETIRAELSSFSKELESKKEVILFTKIDLIDNKKLKDLQKLFKNKEVLSVSIYNEGSLNKLKEEIKKLSK